jgi:tetratricopeptide (TPR) repeat protein
MKHAPWTIAIGFSSLAALALGMSAASHADQIPATKAAAETTEAASTPDLTDAQSRFKNRDFDGALKLLKEAVKKNPDLPPADVILAQWFAASNLSQAVHDSLERAVVNSPDDPEAYLLLGNIAINQHRITEAIMLYEKTNSLIEKLASAKRKEALIPQVYQGLALTNQAREKWEAAKKYWDDLLKLKPENLAALQQLAQCELQMGNEKEALALLKKVSKLDKESLPPETAIFRFFAATERGKDKANTKKWLADALKASPNDIKTQLFASQWYWEKGDLAEAEKHAAAARAIDKASVDANIFSGVIALFRKDYKAAEGFFEAAHLLAPTNFAASNNLALALAEQGSVEKDEAKKQRALQYAEANARANPKSAEAASTYGWVLFKLGRYNEAEEALKAAVSGGQFTPEMAYYLASVLTLNKRSTEGETAKRLLELALKTTAPFAQREDAEKLLDDLKKDASKK